MSKVWLVTGSASGLGRDIAEAVLASGDRLLATARDPHRLNDLVERYGEQVHTAPLDVADEAAAKAAVEKAVEVFGRLDVVVNNAGYGEVAPFEQLSSESFRALVDTDFFGVVYMTRAAIPVMRKQKSGCILQISSVGGRLGVPGNAAYHAAKWAVGGFTESLVPELAPFGVKVCALEPGGIRTSWGERATAGTPELLPDYEASVGTFIKMLQGHWGHEMSAPAKVAQVILQLAFNEQLPAHLLLGSATDPQLVNSWGLTRTSGSVWWVADNVTGVATLYNGPGTKQSLVVTIPPADPNNEKAPNGSPTGIISNGSTTDFMLPGGPAVFIFVTLDGTIAAWNPNVGLANGERLPPPTL